MEITEEQFPLESEVQRLTEANLQELFDLALVRSEFELHGLRIDMLAFDKESGAFVIIEYKKDRNFSVVDQGVAYLNLVSILADIHTGMETNVQIIRIETIPITNRNSRSVVA